MSINTRKQRNYLYSKTFLTWKIEERISEFEKTAIEASLSIHKFGYKADNLSFQNLCEILSDNEIMLEVAEESFPNLRNNIDAIKRSKLLSLKKHTAIIDESQQLEVKANQLKEQASNLTKVIDQQKAAQIKSKKLFRLFNI